MHYIPGDLFEEIIIKDVSETTHTISTPGIFRTPPFQLLSLLTLGAWGAWHVARIVCRICAELKTPRIPNATNTKLSESKTQHRSESNRCGSRLYTLGSGAWAIKPQSAMPTNWVSMGRRNQANFRLSSLASQNFRWGASYAAAVISWRRTSTTTCTKSILLWRGMAGVACQTLGA